MPWHNTPGRYGHLARTLHWTSVALLLAALVTATSFEQPPGTERMAAVGWHVLGGCVLFGVMCARLALRWRSINPVDSYALHPLQRYAAGVVHRTIYALVLTLCATGAVGALASRVPLALPGVAVVPGAIPAQHPLALFCAQAHAALAVAVYPLFALHIGAALVHQLIGVPEADDAA